MGNHPAALRVSRRRGQAKDNSGKKHGVHSLR
jgi:hypothetical protein